MRGSHAGVSCWGLMWGSHAGHHASMCMLYDCFEIRHNIIFLFETKHSRLSFALMRSVTTYFNTTFQVLGRSY